MFQLMKTMRCLANDRKGVTAIEYALIAGLIAVVAVASMKTVGTSLTTLFGTINSSLYTAGG